MQYATQALERDQGLVVSRMIEDLLHYDNFVVRYT